MKSAFLAFLLPLVAAPLGAQGHAGLAEALTLHASFDHGLDADFSRGDRRMYSYATAAERTAGGVAGLTDDAVRIERGTGLSGDALRFTRKVEMKPFFKSRGVLDYNDEHWSGTVSVWLRLDPDADLAPGYCDPIMIVGDHRDSGFIFMEWSKDERPRLFRYAILPRRELWNPTGVPWAEMPAAKRPAVEVARAPFSRDRWTHAVFTFEALNDSTRAPSGKLYLDGALQGVIENWNLTLGWTPDQVLLVLGSSYVGWMDELTVFDRALIDAEVRELHRRRGTSLRAK